MSGGEQHVETEVSERLPDQLCGLLTQQVVSARRGNMAQVERLAARVDAVVAQMKADGSEEARLTASQRTRVMQQYDELALVIEAERADVQARLQKLRQVKRVVGAYNRKKKR
jgi:hypothetical protein